MVRCCRWAASAVVTVLGAAFAAQAAEGGPLRPVPPARPALHGGGALWRAGDSSSGTPWRPLAGAAGARLHPTTRLTEAKLTKRVPPVKRPEIYYFFEIDIVHPPGGTISAEFDALLRRLTNQWFRNHGVEVKSMFLEHVKVTSSVAPRRTLIYYLSMASGDPHITVEFSEYCGFRKKPGVLPGLVQDLRKRPDVGKLIEVSMASAMSHDSRLQNGGVFDSQTGELIVPKSKKGLSVSTLIIIIACCVVGTVAIVGAGLMLYFRIQAESAARYSPFTWMAERRRRSSAASSYRDQDSYVGDEGDFAAQHGAPSFSLSPPERPARGGASEWTEKSGGSEDEDARDDPSSHYDEGELGQSASGRDSRDTSSSFRDSEPGSLPYLPPPGS